MNLICPYYGRVCMLGCEPRCAGAPKINPAATTIPEEEPPFRGILATVIKASETVSLETNLEDEAKLNLNIKL